MYRQQQSLHEILPPTFETGLPGRFTQRPHQPPPLDPLQILQRLAMEFFVVCGLAFIGIIAIALLANVALSISFLNGILLWLFTVVCILGGISYSVVAFIGLCKGEVPIANGSLVPFVQTHAPDGNMPTIDVSPTTQVLPFPRRDA